MIVNPDVDVYTKTRIHRKTSKNSKKQQPTENSLPIYKLRGDPLFTFSLPGGVVRTPAPCQLRNCVSCIWRNTTPIKDYLQMLFISWLFKNAQNWSLHDHWVTRRSATWARAFTATAPTKSIIQASACRQLSLNKFVALCAINNKLIARYDDTSKQNLFLLQQF